MSRPPGIPLHNEYSALRRLLVDHSARYPRARFQDIAKLLFQAEFGPGHMVTNREACMNRLSAEWHSCEKTAEGPEFEAIGGGFFRAHLGGFSQIQLADLCRLFMAASVIRQGSKSAFLTKLGVALDMCRVGQLPMSHSRARRWLMDYKEAGLPQIHHSNTFLQVYTPAYRVVGQDCVAFFTDLPLPQPEQKSGA